MHSGSQLVVNTYPSEGVYIIAIKGQVTQGLLAVARWTAPMTKRTMHYSNMRQCVKLDEIALSDGAQFRRRLLGWYDRHKRDLPWRGSRDPYCIWLSEIMLQQTRVAVVVDYYQRFLQRFPTVRALAAARTSSVLAAWSGLGYYRRARMLHAAAKKIVREHGGEFPKTFRELGVLPGIGRYTAAAVASIAFGEVTAVVDGNVERVLQRVQGRKLATCDLWKTASTLVSLRRPGDFNQAIMELGATVCLPRKPRCAECPVSSMCASRGELSMANKQLRKKGEIHYGLSCENDSVFLQQRPRDASLMPGMWELPEAPSNGNESCLTLRHSITVTDYRVRVWHQPAPEHGGGRWVSRAQITRLPLTGLTRKILRKVNMM
jgi:A/G-specific adenine glycosylase